MKYVVSEKALEVIVRECRSYPETETGGIIVGFRNAKQVTITHATGPGLNWQRSAHHFSKDTGYLAFGFAKIQLQLGGATVFEAGDGAAVKAAGGSLPGVAVRSR